MPNLELLWPRPPDQRPFSDKDVHVWAVDLDKHIGPASSLEQILSQDEWIRARQFKFETDRNRFIAGRGLLRKILSSYLQVDAAKLRFKYSPRGKPALEGIGGRDALEFNVAHSKGLILIAVTRACAVGIDVESIRPMNDAEDIATRFFSTREIAKLMALPKSRRTTVFFSLWTRKEAWLKATGYGISEMLKEVEMAFLPEEAAEVLAISGNVEAAQSWMMMELAPAPEFAAAAAVEAKGLQFSCWQWPS